MKSIRIALPAALLFILFLTSTPKGYTQDVSSTFNCQSITGTKSYAQLAGGIFYLGFKTSIPKELILEFFKGQFPKLPYTITCKQGSEGEQMSKVFYFDNPKTGDPYFATQSGTITITAYCHVAKIISGKFYITSTRPAFDENMSADSGKSFQITECVFTDIKIQ